MRAVVKEAVHETLTTMGFDVKEPLESQRDMAALREVRLLASDPEFQRDLAHLRQWRKTMENVKSKGVLGAAGLMVLGGAAAIVYAFKVKLLGL